MTAPAILPANAALADRLTGDASGAGRTAVASLLILPAAALAWGRLPGLSGCPSAAVFYSIDEFSGVVKEEFTLKTYAELFRAIEF